MLLYSAALTLIFITAVSSQSVMNGFIGEEVLLPCIYSGYLPDRVNISWRDKDNNVVLAIIDGKEVKGNPKFGGRVFIKANFSILIKDLRANDAGLYECCIHGVPYDNTCTTNLTITEKPAVKATTPRPAPTPAPRDAAMTSSLHLALLSAPLLVLLRSLQ